MPRKAREATKILKYDPWQRTFIYEIIDPQTKRAIYVGRSNDVVRRGAEHDRKGSPLLKEYVKLHDFRLRDAVRIVPELPNGVPASRAAEFEAYFIMQRDTLYHAKRRVDGCNQKNGDYVVALDYDAIEADVAEGFEWPEVPVDVAESRAKVAVFEELVAVFGDTQPDLQLALSEAAAKQKARERAYLTPLAISEQLAEEYDKMSKYEEIDRTVFERDVNSIRDRLNNEDVIDDKMLSLVRAIAMFGKSEGAEWQMRAHVAVHAFKMLAGALETREEARMPDTVRRVRKTLENTKTSFFTVPWSSRAIRFSEEKQLIDVMDCLCVLYRTDGSAKVAQNKYLSKKDVGATEEIIGVENGKLLHKVKWEDSTSNRTAVSVSAMKSMLDRVYNTIHMSAKLSNVIDHSPLTVANANGSNVQNNGCDKHRLKRKLSDLCEATTP